MSIELEVGGAASVGSLTTKQTADLSGQACKNCGKPVEGRYCEHCGQLAASFHRPIWALISETVSDSLLSAYFCSPVWFSTFHYLLWPHQVTGSTLMKRPRQTSKRVLQRKRVKAEMR